MLICCYAAACAAAWQLVNASADDLALALFVLRVGEWFPPPPSGFGAPLADTRRAVHLRALLLSQTRRSGGRLLCLHALSSFQRTGSPTSHASRRDPAENPTDRPFLTVFRGTF